MTSHESSSVLWNCPDQSCEFIAHCNRYYCSNNTLKFQLCCSPTIERASPSLSPSSLLMLMDWPYSVVRSFRSLCRAHILCPAAGHRIQQQYIFNICIKYNWTLEKRFKNMDHTVPRALSWAQAAREAAKRGTMLLLEAKLSLKSSRQVTRSMEGQDRMQRSDSKSLGPEERREKGSVSGSQCTSQGSGALMVWFKFIFIYANAQREFCFDSLISGDKTSVSVCCVSSCGSPAAGMMG